jgi:LacI family transcriptional regulator
MTRLRIAVDVSGVGVLENYRMDVVRGVIRFARQHTDWELLYNIDDFSLVHSYRRFEDLHRLGADGIIFSYWEREKVHALEQLRIPMVSITNLADDIARRFPCVLSDDVEAGRIAARHFLDRGFRHFACYGDIAGRRWEAGRHQGFTEVLEPLGIPCHILADQPFGDPPRAGRRLARWLANLPRPLAILGATDSRAFHILEACHAVGLRVPLDVGIVGVDNNHFICEAQAIALTSVAPDAERVGVEAAALLHRSLGTRTRARRRPIPPQTVVVPPRGIHVRASSDIIAADDAALSRAMHHIREHHAEPLAIDAVVAVSGVSRSTLERRFRERLGISINDALRRQRLDTAKRLLAADPALSLDDIAVRSGFRRATYLCNVFREETGQTPRDWAGSAPG